MKIAVVADVHLHDLYGGYGWIEEGSGDIALRTFEDTMASTRVFNESHAAFLAVLEDIVRRGIRDVVLLGDYCDDGQFDAVAALVRILSSYEARHGLRFFTTFGNHDCYGPAPRHQAKRLTRANGRDAVLVTSDETASAPAVFQAGMLGMSTADAMQAMAHYGIARPERVFHWETPFCGSAHAQHRRPADSGTFGLDASYLVEPQQGLWLLMLDANVFHQVDGVWQVRSNAAWDHVLTMRPYLLEWIADVAERARRLDKTLLAFSHYPALPLAMTGRGDQLRSACTPDWQKRMPALESGRRLAEAGLRWHFSGHMHVSGRTELDGLINIAVPSPVAYPGGYVAVITENGLVNVETVSLVEATGFDIGFAAYENQMSGAGPADRHHVPGCRTYSEFLNTHLRQLIARRHAPLDWPPDLLDDLDWPIEDVLRGDTALSAVVGNWRYVVSKPFRLMMEDYYFLRAGGRAALDDIPPDHIGFYRDLQQALSLPEPANEHFVGSAFLVLFLACLDLPEAS